MKIVFGSKKIVTYLFGFPMLFYSQFKIEKSYGFNSDRCEKMAVLQGLS